MWSTLLWTLVGTGAALSWDIPKTIRNPPRNERYFSGEVHNEIMRNKTLTWEAAARRGAFDSSKYKPQNYTRCVDGYAGEFKCKNVDLYSFKSHAELGSDGGRGSSSWGWTYRGVDYAIIAQSDGAAFTRINKRTGDLEYLGRLPQTPGVPAVIWRELRVSRDILVIGSEAVGHHVQIFDLKKVSAIKPSEIPKVFDPVTDLLSLFDLLPVGRTHNIVVNPELQYGVSVGAQPRNSTFASGLVFFDLKNPKNPKLLGYQAEDGYVHDAQCLLYRGPDKRFRGKDICYGYNEDTLTIYDVTNKANATIISRTSYEGASYTHQGWVLDTNDQRYLLLDDELDERNQVGPAADGFPVTFIWDIQDLTAPVLTGGYKSTVKGIDHNQYVHKGFVYQSNYGAGLRILDVRSIPRDPTGAGVKEVGFIDVFPEDDEAEGGGTVAFQGTWSSYALYESGWIIVNTMDRGAFVVRYTGRR